jgi:hypothetical protein
VADEWRARRLIEAALSVAGRTGALLLVRQHALPAGLRAGAEQSRLPRGSRGFEAAVQPLRVMAIDSTLNDQLSDLNFESEGRSGGRLSAAGNFLLLWITGRPIPKPTRGWVLRAGCATPAWGD